MILHYCEMLSQDDDTISFHCTSMPNPLKGLTLEVPQVDCYKLCEITDKNKRCKSVL